MRCRPAPSAAALLLEEAADLLVVHLVQRGAAHLRTRLAGPAGGGAGGRVRQRARFASGDGRASKRQHSGSVVADPYALFSSRCFSARQGLTLCWFSGEETVKT